MSETPAISNTIKALRCSLQELFSPIARRPPLFFVFLCLGAALPIYFTLYTRLAWEDFFITYRFSENLARGHGLVYTPGERVYGFTSPLNTLLPALFAAVFAAKDFTLPLWLFRGVSLGGLIVAFISIASVFSREPSSSRVRFFLGAAFPLIAALEIKTTAFAMSGQEAGLVIGFLAPAFALAVLGWNRHWILGGLLGAGLMYSRPDAFIDIAAIVAAALVFAEGPRKPLLLSLGRSAVICALLYLPWFLFTWWYYGSPVPHTVIAKHDLLAYDHGGFGAMAPLVAGLARAPAVLCRALAPIYDMLNEGPGSWPHWLNDAALGLELIAVLYWLAPTRDRFGRMASLAAFILCAYLTYASLTSLYSPWYYPPLAFLSLAALISAAATFADRIAHPLARLAGAALLPSGLALFLGFIFFSSLAPLRFKQEVIEWGQRRLIGLWLKEHVGGNETVYLEPLGYIGYFSQCKMVDWPGLVSPAVVAARRKIVRGDDYYTWSEVAEAIKPAWIVARPAEADRIDRSDFLSHHYDLVKVFDVRAEIEKLGSDATAPGMNLAYSEAAFGVYRRRD
jgi:hypothetical protein